MSLQHVGHLFLEIVELKGRQEAERAEVERHHRRHGLLEQQRRVQQRPIAAQANDKIDAIS